MQGFTPALMFGFFKKLVSKGEPEAPAAASPKPAQAAPPPPQAPRVSSPTIAPLAKPIPGAAPVARMGTGGAKEVPVAAASPGSGGPVVEIPFADFFPKLNPEARKLALREPANGEALRLPWPRIQQQLGTGRVRITVGELRQLSPPGLFGSPAGTDGQTVEIPLAVILPRLSPEQTRRRTDQRKVELPPEIAPIFGPGGAEVRVATERTVPPPTGKKPLAAQPAAKAPEVPRISPAPPAAQVQPAAPPPPAPALADQPIRAPRLDPSLAKAPAPAGAAAPKRPGGEVFVLPLMDVVNFWAKSGKEKLAGMYRHTLEMPLDRVEFGLKRGKLIFPWRQFKEWVRLGAGATFPDVADEEQIELPLAIVAPRFLEEHPPRPARKRVAISPEIPDIFDLKPPAEPSKAPAPVPVETAAAAPAEKPAPGPEPVPEFGEIFGQPAKRGWTVNEIVRECASLSGVSGALIATADGLLVAGFWPEEGAKGETVAAFLPQMHGRVAQYSNELKLGDPARFTLLIEDTPLQVFKTGASFFIVLGKAGENLPKSQLTAVALRLAQNSAK